MTPTMNLNELLDNEQTASLFGSVLPMIGIRVVVREEDEPQAVKVLDETFGPEEEQLSEAELAAQAEAAPLTRITIARKKLMPGLPKLALFS